jgi:hypothetical protein
LRAASISVGIGDYLHKEYRESAMLLKYAVGDARAFSLYARGADDDSDGAERRHQLLTDGQATWERMLTAAEGITTEGRLDLFTIYLSGHGEAGDGAAGGWFCLVDAEAGKPGLTANRLDELLIKVDASNTLLIVDCCFAEAVVGGCRFFDLLGRSRSRFVIASARADQRSWEDDGLGRSLFSDVLIRSLSVGSSVADGDGYVDVERALFPVLREQVPLLASSEKAGAVQEPVTSGIAASNLRLPTVVAASLGRSLSTAEAVRAGIRRGLIGGLAAVLSVFVALELLVYHLAVDPSGSMVVRPGLKRTYDFQPFHAYRSIDSGIRINQVARGDDAAVKRLADGDLWGFRTHLDGDGLRTWLAPLEEMLNRSDRQSIEVFARSMIAPFKADEDAAPLVEATFLAGLRNANAASIGQVLYPQDVKVGISCDADAARILDFGLTSSSAEVFASDAAWASATAPQGAEQRAFRLSMLLRLAAYRAQGEEDDDVRKREFRSFATAALRFVALASDREAFAARMKQELVANRGGWCALHATFLAALLEGLDSGRASEGELWRILFTYDRSKQGDVATAQQTLAGLALSFIAIDHDLDSEKVVRLANTIEASGAGLDVSLPPQSLLREIGQSRGYPAPVQSLLESKLGVRKGEFDFSNLVAAKVLACAGRKLDPALRTRLAEWMQSNIQNNHTMSDFADALGCLSAFHPLDDEQLRVLLDRLSPASRFPSPTATYRGVQVISSNGDRAAVALGRYAQRYTLPEDRIDQLANVVASRPDLDGRREIIRGLAARWYGADAASANALHRRISGAVSDSRRRDLEIEVAAEHVAVSSPADRGRIKAELADRWRNEPEPEMRIALAKLLGMVFER